MALGLTQPLTKINTRNISRGKGGRCLGLIILPPHEPNVLKSGSLKFPEPTGPVQVCNEIVYPPTFFSNSELYSETMKLLDFARIP
jgi:hypothetical protein